ncbi:MAG: epoxyqueuosine reductase QueH [Ruminococcaceae bacterium]|nr:epoxyqueuosine reductase QueH [Oscillospiraceae bacterium]
MKENYGLMLENILKNIDPSAYRPTLLLHACCAPCSSYVLEYLSEYFDITLYYHNPNIYPQEEFLFRLNELKRFSAEAGYNIPIEFPEYDSREFFDAVKGMEDLSEGGERCRVCYELRLRKTALAAKGGGYDYFTTTLSISPHKNAQWLNEIGAALEKEFGVKYLHSDFKKKNGYKRSIELSGEYGLYRQDYCGCVYSKAEAEKRNKK